MKTRASGLLPIGTHIIIQNGARFGIVREHAAWWHCNLIQWDDDSCNEYSLTDLEAMHKSEIEESYPDVKFSFPSAVI